MNGLKMSKKGLMVKVDYRALIGLKGVKVLWVERSPRVFGVQMSLRGSKGSLRSKGSKGCNNF